MNRTSPKKNKNPQQNFLVVKTKTTRSAASSYSHRDGPFKKNKMIASSRYSPPATQDHNNNLPTAGALNPEEQQQERPQSQDVHDHHLVHHEEMPHCHSSFAESRGKCFNKSNSSVSALLINVAATRPTRNSQEQEQVAPQNVPLEPTRQPSFQQCAPMQQPRQDSDVNHVMEAAQRLYYQRMVDSHAMHQNGHFAMMFRHRHQAPPTTVRNELQPTPRRLQPQQRHSGFVGNTSPIVPNTPRGGAESNVPETRFVNVPETRFVDGRNVQQLRHLLTPQDRHLTTQFTVNVIDQLDFVNFEEGDRRSHRTHLSIGFRGICCRHCKAAPGKSGRFFPSSLKTLSDTQKTLYTFHRHLMKCRQTPDCLKQTLHKLRENHLNERKTLKSHGSQRAFFRIIWGLLFPDAEGDSIASCAMDKTKKAKDGKKI